MVFTKKSSSMLVRTALYIKELYSYFSKESGFRFSPSISLKYL